MRLGEGVEWALHCCTVLAGVPEGTALPAAKLAELHQVPPAYLAKHLQALASAGIVSSTAGRHGGYRLATPPGSITVLDVVVAVEGGAPAFDCTEIRQRGPVVGPPSVYRRPCGIAAVMWRAEEAWRAELAGVTIADLVRGVIEALPPELLARTAAWVAQVDIQRKRREP